MCGTITEQSLCICGPSDSANMARPSSTTTLALSGVIDDALEEMKSLLSLWTSSAAQSQLNQSEIRLSASRLSAWLQRLTSEYENSGIVCDRITTLADSFLSNQEPHGTFSFVVCVLSKQ